VDRSATLLLVCDLGLTGRAAEARQAGRSRLLPWLVLTQGAPDVAWGAVLDAGARAVMGPDLGLDDLVSAIETVRQGGSPMSEIERQSLLRRWRAASGLPEPLWRQLARLSPEEGDILTMLYEGTTVRAIADRYGISEAAVRAQVQSVLRRLASRP
jgi:DNA-binding NarL/FixJ family response regulator